MTGVPALYLTLKLLNSYFLSSYNDCEREILYDLYHGPLGFPRREGKDQDFTPVTV